MPEVNPGICAGCRHVRIIQSDRGSIFYWCGRSKSDPTFAKYPRLPVWTCRGFEEPQPESQPGNGPPPPD